MCSVLRGRRPTSPARRSRSAQPRLWLQLGIASQEARAIAADAGLLYVEDRCLLIERHRLDLDAPQSQ